MFWEVISHPYKCKFLLKLKLDVVLGDSSAPLSALANTVFSVDAEVKIFNNPVQHNIWQDLKYHHNGFLSDNLKKLSG